jgi:hypothetical protein
MRVSASRPMKSPLSSATAKPSPLRRIGVGRHLRRPVDIALFQPQRLDRPVARHRTGRAARPPRQPLVDMGVCSDGMCSSHPSSPT